MRFSILLATVMVSAVELVAQQSQPLSAIPFIGCPSDGQAGPIEAPTGKDLALPIKAEVAQRLAYYAGTETFGVLGPRGWHCLRVYGSGGESIEVTPEVRDWDSLTGPAIQLIHRYIDTSGRFSVAEIIGRVFPAFVPFACNVVKDINPDRPDCELTLGSYPGDRLTYKSNTAVEYRTPANSEGLGSHWQVKKNGAPIEGVVILVDKVPDLLHLAVRLPQNQADLTAEIIHQVEREAERLPKPNVP